MRHPKAHLFHTQCPLMLGKGKLHLECPKQTQAVLSQQTTHTSHGTSNMEHCLCMVVL